MNEFSSKKNRINIINIIGVSLSPLDSVTSVLTGLYISSCKETTYKVIERMDNDKIH